MAFSYKNDSDSDNRANPVSTSQKLASDEKKASHPGPDFTYEDTPRQSSSDKLNDAEGTIPYERTRDLASPGSRRRGQRGSISGKAFWKRKGPAGIIIGILFGGGALVGTLGPSLAGFAFIENTLGDVNDKLAALTVGNNNILRNKLVKTAKSGVVSGCTKVSIACKMRTFSNSELARMERAGIKVINDGRSVIPGRTKASGVEFQGRTYTPDEWASELSSNSKARNAQLRANNMKYRGLSVNGPFGKVMARFGISKKAPGLSGSKQDRLNQLLTAAGASDPRDIRFAEVVNSEGETDGRRVMITEGMEVESGTVSEANIPDGAEIYSSEEYEKVQSNLSRTVDAKPPSATKKASIGAASALGIADLACSIKHMVTGASMAAKISNEAQLVTYAMPLLSSINKIKAGDGTPEDAETIGDFLTQVDNRRQIEGVTVEEGASEPQANSVLVDNPNYGKSAMDSRLLSMSTNGGLATPTESMSQFSLGLSMTSLFAGFGNVALQATETVNSIGGESACRAIQHPLTRIAGIAIAAAGGVFTGGGSVALQATIMGAMIAGMYVLEQTLNYAFSGDMTDGIEENPVGRGEALWTGIAAMEGATSRMSGLMPSSVDDIRSYSQLSKAVDQDYIALEMDDAKKSPFDITNQYSFVGSTLRTLASNFSYSSRPQNILSGIATTSLGILNPIKQTKAAEFDEDRFSMCDDENYQEIGIDADVQCNVRYTMPAEDLKLQPDDVIAYMHNNNFVLEDSETGLPEGYIPPDQRKSQNIIVGAIKGMTVGAFVDDRNLTDEYSKYLEACVYRTAPYGETGEEVGLVGALGDWADGEKCREDSPQLSNFRMYTLYKSITDMNDQEEDFDAYSQSLSTGAQENQSTPVDNPDDLPHSDGWVWPIKEGLRAGPCWGRNVGSLGAHAGMDINSSVPNAPIYAMHDGEVVAVSHSSSGAAGRYVQVRASNGMYYMYQHLSSVSVNKGDSVRANQVIARGGKTGRVYASSPVHLHLVVARTSAIPSYGNLRTSVNPMSVLPAPAPNNYRCN